LKITKEDFDAWKGNPVTEAVFKALEAVAEEAKQKWVEASWGGGQSDPLVLREMKGRAEVALGLVSMDFDFLEETQDEGTGS
jgi:hypothetical protein